MKFFTLEVIYSYSKAEFSYQVIRIISNFEGEVRLIRNSRKFESANNHNAQNKPTAQSKPFAFVTR